MAFCGKCGQQNPDGAAFCAKCGAPLKRAADAAPVNSPSQERSSSGFTRIPLRREATPPPPPRRESESDSPRRQRESCREDEQPRGRQYRGEEEQPSRRRYRNEEEQPPRQRYRDEDEYDDDVSEDGGFTGNLISLVKRSSLMIAIGAVVMFLIMWLFS